MVKSCETVFEILYKNMRKSCEAVFGLSFQMDFDANLKRGHNDTNSIDLGPNCLQRLSVDDKSIPPVR